MVWELTGPRGKLITTTLLNEYGGKPSLKFTFLYLYFSAALRLYQRNVFVQWMVSDTETQNWSW